MKCRTIVMLACDGDSTRIIYNSLKNIFPIEKVIMETRISRSHFLKRRIKKYGFFSTFGQILFRLIVVPYLKIVSQQRIRDLKNYYELDDSSIDRAKSVLVASVNTDDVKQALKEINPHIVIINGTRIISDEIINCTTAKFINMHAGITPLYRGVHGGYWALVEDNEKACGVTIHLVDTGIDTGKILEQGLINVTQKDNFVTYPILQLAIGLPLLKKAIMNILEDKLEFKAYPDGTSRLWSHPSLWEYIRNRIYYGIK